MLTAQQNCRRVLIEAFMKDNSNGSQLVEVEFTGGVSVGWEKLPVTIIDAVFFTFSHSVLKPLDFMLQSSERCLVS